MYTKIRILHLEDQRSDADIVRRELMKSDINHELLWVANKKDFQKALSEFSPSIILSDHSLPSFGSLQALKIIKDAKIDIPFILITAAMSDEFAVDLMKEGISDYILKDRLQRLPKAIVNVMEKYFIQKEREIYFNEIIRNEKLFRALIENNKASITLFDESFQPLFFDSSKEHITGYTIDERTKMSRVEMAHPEDASHVKKVMQEVLANPGKPIPSAYRIQHKNGSYIYVEGTVTNMLHNENVKGIVSNFLDVTERKIAQDKIAESETKYRALVEQASDAIIVAEMDGSIQESNTKAEKLTGYSKEQLINMSLKDLLFENDLHVQVDKINNGNTIVYEQKIIRKDNVTVDVEISARRIKDGRILGIFRDITEKKTREIQQEFDRNNLNALINNTSDLMWSVDRDFNLITSNQPFDEMSKKNFGKVIAKGSSVLSVAYSEEMRNHFKLFYERAFEGETFTEIEHFDFPEELWTEISYYPILKGDEIIGTACHSRDITHIKKSEEKLLISEIQIRNFAKHLNKMQEEERSSFARELHDELGQQLAGIKMGLSLITMLHDQNKMVEKARIIMKDVDEAIQSMRRIATELRPGILDSLGLIPSLEWLGEEFQRKKGIKCTTKIKVKELRFEKNISTCFFRICQESLTNIFKHAEATEVKIEVYQIGDELTLKVTDNGKGISTDKLDNPFSMGLLGMRERASAIGANLTVSGTLGTTIQLQVIIK